MDSREAAIKRRDNALITPALSRIRDVGREQDPRLEQRTGRMLALVNERFQRLALFHTQSDNICLQRDL